MWDSTWRPISARIEALLEVGKFAFATGEGGASGAASYLIRDASNVREDLIRFFDLFRKGLPLDAGIAFDRFRMDFDRHIQSGLHGAAIAISLLGAFRAELNFLTSNTESRAQSLVVRAVTHLQRLIVADERVRKQWVDAYEDRETTCEKLGACHLLLHGIWAFKAHAEGGRSDLVLGGRLKVTDDILSSTEALVLTEWKVVRSQSELEEKASQAFKQAYEYAGGILAGFELARKRYLILVSQKDLGLPDPKICGDVTYEYLNIAVDPDPPSRATKRTT